MGLDLSRTPAAATDAAAVVEAQPYDIAADRRRLSRDLAGLAEIDRLTGQIEVYRPDSIAAFGAEAAEEIAKVSDAVLNGMSMAQIGEPGELFTALKRVMDKFDLDEIKKEPGLLGRLFGDMKKRLDKILDKYRTMGEEVDRIYVQLKQYEAEIGQANRNLEAMFEANVGYYHELVKHILAGEQGCRELEAHIAQRKAALEASGDNAIRFELTELEQALQLLEQRIQDLRTAEMVAIQAIPMLKTMAFSNMNVARKINSAFIVTLPVFKQALAQAIMLKRQRLQAEAMAELDRKTNELLLQNAQNAMEQSKLTARLASGGGIRIETLENAWRTIVSGIDETRAVEENARKQRLDDQKRLEAIKADFMAKFQKSV